MASRAGQRRWPRRTLLLLFFLALGFAVAVVTRQRWGPPALEGALARFAGIEARIGASEGPWLDRLVLHDVHLRGTPRRPEVGELAFERLELEYDLFELARGRIGGLRAVRARGARGALDFRPREPRPLEERREPRAGPAWPARWPELDLEVRELDVAFGAGVGLVLERSRLHLEPAGEEAPASLAIDGAALRWRDAARAGGPLSAAPFALRAQDDGGGHLRVQRLALDPWLRLARGELELGGAADGRWRARADFEALAGRGRFAFARDGDRTTASLAARALDLAALAGFPFLEEPLAAARDLRGKLDLEGEVIWPAAGLARASGTVRFEAVDPGWEQRSAEFARGELVVSEERIEVRELSLVQAPNLVEVPWLVVPRDAPDRCLAWRDAVASFRIDAADLATLAGTPVWRELPPHRLALEGELRAGIAELVRGDFSIVGGEVVLERGRAPLVASLEELFVDPALDLELRARFSDLAPLGKLLSHEPWSGSLDLAARVRGTPEGTRGAIEARGADVTFAGRPIGALELTGEVDRHRLHLERLSARSAQGTLACVVDYDFGSRVLEIAALESWFEDLSIYWPEVLPRANVRIAGAAKGVWPALDGRVEISARDVAWRGRELATLDLEVQRDASRFTVVRLSASGEQGSVRARGAFEPREGGWAIDLEELALEREDRTLALSDPVAVVVSEAGVRASDFELVGSAGSIDGAFDVARDRGELSLSFDDFDPAPLAAAPWRAALGFRGIDGVLEASWSSAGLELVTVDASVVLDLGGELAPGTLALRARSEGERLELAELSLRSGAETLLDAAGSLPLPARDASGRIVLPDLPFALRARADLEELEHLAPIARLLGVEGRPSGGLTLWVELAGSTADLSGTVEASARALSITAADQRVVVPPFDLDVALELGPRIALRSGRFAGPGGLSIAAAGIVDAAPDLARVISEGVGWVARAPLELALFLEEAELAAAVPFAPWLRRAGGVVRGELSLSGTIEEPRWRGSLVVVDGELRTTTSLPAIADVDGELRFDGESLSIEDLRGDVGGAPFVLRGTYRLQGPERGAEVELSGENLLLFRQSGVTIRADAELVIRGPIEALEVGGTVFVRDSRYVRDLDFLSLGRGGPSASAARGLHLFSIDEPPFSDLRFDVAIRTLEPVRIANNTVEGSLRPELQLEGTGLLPVLRGRIYVDQTRVRLPASSLRVRSGTIDFLPQRPYLPELELAAEARLQGYDISIRVSGPYDQPVIDLSSVPPLGHEDLLLLVLTGRPPGEAIGARTGQRAAQEVAVYVARDVFGGWFGGGGDEGESIAERIEVFQGEDISRSGRETTEVRFRIAEGMWLENDALLLVGERDVYERYNFGVRLLFRFP